MATEFKVGDKAIAIASPDHHFQNGEEITVKEVFSGKETTGYICISSDGLVQALVAAEMKHE